MEQKKAFIFFKKLHKDQTYSDWSPYWPHLLRTANILRYYLELYKECDKKTRDIIITSCYGHDSLEDTSISRDKLTKLFWNKIAELIRWMTNERWDRHTGPYIKKICWANEEIRLIKLADLCDNYTSIIYRALENWPKFLKSTIIPIMDPMYKNIIKSTFKKYKKTAKNLIFDVKRLHAIATEALENMI